MLSKKTWFRAWILGVIGAWCTPLWAEERPAVLEYLGERATGMAARLPELPQV